MKEVLSLMRNGRSGALASAPARSGAGLAALLGYGPRQALANSLPQQRESLGDVLSRSIPSTLQEVLAHSLGVDPHEQQQQQEPDDQQEPEPDTSTASKLPPLPELPPLAESLAVFEQWRGTGDAHE